MMDPRIEFLWIAPPSYKKEQPAGLLAMIKFALVKDGKREWKTKEPAICTFGKGQWFNTIGMLREDGVHYYCNIGSPYRWHNSALEYIDYDLDVRVFPDRTYMILDQDEYEEHRRQMGYPESVRKQIDQGLNELLSLIFQQKLPFEPEYVERWYERFLQYK